MTDRKPHLFVAPVKGAQTVVRAYGSKQWKVNTFNGVKWVSRTMASLDDLERTKADALKEI